MQLDMYLNDKLLAGEGASDHRKLAGEIEGKGRDEWSA